MDVIEKILDSKGNHFASYSEEFAQIVSLATEAGAKNILCVNPRSGSMVFPLIGKGAILDSFVSDDEWVQEARSFSRRVVFGHSHHPLAEIGDESYDMVFVCEDFALADDCDAMALQYHRLLKRGGVLLCGIWNMSYCGYLDALISGGSLPDDFYDPLHGMNSFTVDTLRLRLERIGFSAFEKTDYRPAGTDESGKKYAGVSRHMEIPADEARFLAKIFFIKAVK